MGKLLKCFCITLCVGAIGLGAACSSGQPDTEGVNMNDDLTLTLPEEEVYPYMDIAKEYLEAGAGADVRNYFMNLKSPCKGVRIEWKYDGGESVESYTLTYATKPDYSDGIELQLDGDQDSCSLYNLYKATTYYCRIEANLGAPKGCVAEGSFQTTELGPRVMQIDGIYNTRDLGGYMTDGGVRTKQGLIYRGGSLLPADIYDGTLTEDGQAYMCDTLGIKTDLDIRGKGTESNDLTKSPIPGAQLLYVTLGGYASAFSMTENFRQAFSFLADKNNYPVYVHCTGGADRTGTLSFLFNALLGVSETELIQDYEFTSFSIYGERNSKAGTTYGDMFQEFLTKLNAYDGDTLKEKTENYLLHIGVTQTEIANIRSIMLGE